MIMNTSQIMPSRPEHISAFDESTQKPFLIHVDSIAAIFTESQEQHTHDGPILLGVRFLYKHGQESFFYIDEKKYGPLILAFSPTAVGEELRIDTKELENFLKEK
jgi:hypothetical protein